MQGPKELQKRPGTAPALATSSGCGGAPPLPEKLPRQRAKEQQGSFWRPSETEQNRAKQSKTEQNRVKQRKLVDLVKREMGREGIYKGGWERLGRWI